MKRYDIITEKDPREIVLLRGRGCFWKKCAFCDYHLDVGSDIKSDIALDREVLSLVTGKYKKLEVINSGSVFELPDEILALIKQICLEKGIDTLCFETHYHYRERVPALRRAFSPIDLKLKLGVETFDFEMREGFMKKGIPEREPGRIADGFDQVDLLFGITGQTAESMKRDMELALSLFERACVNIMSENTTSVKPDPHVTAEFKEKIYPIYKDDARVDILMHNTDFGVGGEE